MKTHLLLVHVVLSFGLALSVFAPAATGITNTEIAASAKANQGSTSIDLPTQPVLAHEFSLKTGTRFSGIEFGGISGLTPTASPHEYLAISDDRSEHAPARFYTITLTPSAHTWQFALRQSHTLKMPDGRAYATGTLDPEAIVRLPSGDIFWSSEGDRKHRPALYLADNRGVTKKQFPLPDTFRHNKKKKYGIRRNRGPEGMTLMPNGKQLLLAMEDALYQDGEEASQHHGALIRLLQFDIENSEWGAQYAYPTEAIPKRALVPPFMQLNGVSDIQWLDDSRLLVVERAYSAGEGNVIRVFITSLQGASPWRDGKPVIPLSKKLWFEIPSAAFGELTPDNIEAITLGPVVSGKRTLILVSDNNFSRFQKTQFVILTF